MGYLYNENEEYEHMLVCQTIFNEQEEYENYDENEQKTISRLLFCDEGEYENIDQEYDSEEEEEYDSDEDYLDEEYDSDEDDYGIPDNYDDLPIDLELQEEVRIMMANIQHPVPAA